MKLTDSENTRDAIRKKQSLEEKWKEMIGNAFSCHFPYNTYIAEYLKDMEHIIKCMPTSNENEDLDENNQ